MNKHKSLDGMTHVSQRLAQIRAEENKRAKDSFWVRYIRPVMKFVMQVVGATFVVGTSLLYVIDKLNGIQLQFGYAVGIAIFVDAVALFFVFDKNRK